MNSIDKSFNLVNSLKNDNLSSQWDEYDLVKSGSELSSRSEQSESNNNTWHIYNNPLIPFVEINEVISSRGPPLFALRFPDLFVY